jgi:hypothetical protein
MNLPGARLRRATRADADAIAALHTESWRSAYGGLLPAHQLGRGLDNERRRHWRAALARASARDVVLVADTGRQLIGFVAIWTAAPLRPAYVDNLHVHPGQRGTGVGRRLLGEAARRLVACRRRSAYLWVFRANGDAIGFYRRLGGRILRHACDAFPRARAPTLRIAWRDLRRLAAQARR